MFLKQITHVQAAVTEYDNKIPNDLATTTIW